MTAALDVEKFRKVQALARSGATAGERAAASSRMDAMAKAAGMSVDAAKERAGTVSEEERLAAHLRREHEQMRAKPERRERRRKLAEQHGSEEAAEAAIFVDTPWEAALRRAVESHVVRAKTTGWEMGSLSGWDGGRDMPAHVRAAIEGAYPFPASVSAAWVEHREWDHLHHDRDAFDPWYDSPVWDRAWEHVLGIALDTIPAASLDDIVARLDWMEHLHRRGFSRDVHDDLTWLATLRADVARLAEGSAQSAHPSSVQNGQAQGAADCAHPSAGVQSGHLTASGRRALVLSILDTAEGAALSDREIARRAGVSPTTVGKLRRTAR